MLPLLRSELFRLSRRWMPRLLLLIVAAATVLLYLILWVVLRQSEGSDAADLRDQLRPAAVPEFGLLLTVWALGTILATILGASSIGTEFGWGTIRTLLPRARGRTALLTAKWLALGLFVVTLVLTGWLVALGMSALVTAAEGLDGGVGGGYAWDTAAALARTAFVIVPYAALAFLVALWARSNAAGISVGLAVLFLEDLIVFLLTAASDSLDWVGDLFLSQNADAVMALNDTVASGNEFSSDLPDVWRAAAILAGWTVLFVALSYAIFRRRDVTSGS